MLLVLVAVGIVLMSFAVHASYGVVILVSVTAATALVLRTGNEIAQRDRVVSDRYDVVSTVLQENVAGARVIRAFGRESEEIGKFGGRLTSFTGGWRGLARFWTSRMPAINSIYNLAIPAALLVGVYRVRAGVGSVGEVATVLFYVSLMKNRLRMLTRLVIMGQEAVASATRVFEVLDHEEEIAAPAHPKRLPEGDGELVLDGLSFAHRGDLSVLRGLTLRVPAGSSLGIIGPTGAGKSTLVSLLPRYYDPDEGRILLDGVDLRDLDPAELRRQVGLVFQEAFLFSATIAENLACGRPGATRDEIEHAAPLAAAHDFIAALPACYDTMVGERGVSLSGGQRQRLTIARALVGPTGAGKSSIANLVARFYEAQEGVVRIDGHDVRDLRVAALHRQMGIVLQESFLFAGSVLENLRFVRPDLSPEEAQTAFAELGCEEVLARLPAGLATDVGERGANLSEGERQIVCFARALVGDPSILILDEATSAVDTHTEILILRALHRLAHHQTTFVIAHRLSTIRDADLILVVEAGRIVEQGTHDELLRSGGAYAALYAEYAR